MGRVIRSEVIAIRCDVSTCESQIPVDPQPSSTDWEASLKEIREAVVDGWAFVLNVPLRAFCPVDAERVSDCTCRTHPTRSYRCTVHSTETQLQVWTRDVTPTQVIAVTANARGIST